MKKLSADRAVPAFSCRELDRGTGAVAIRVVIQGARRLVVDEAVIGILGVLVEAEVRSGEWATAPGVRLHWKRRSYLKSLEHADVEHDLLAGLAVEVGDAIHSCIVQVPAEHERIDAGAALEDVVTSSANKDICACATVQDVAPATAREKIVALGPVDPVVSGLALK
jgi:hypothetical protein